MSIGNKPIEVFLRHCYSSPNQNLPSRKRPSWFDKQKVFENFKRTINPALANYTVIYDNHFGPPPEFLKDEKLIEINAGNEASSFLQTLDYIESLNLDPETIIYLLEDDYLHREGWCSIMLEGFELGFDFQSLYDHKDKYLHYPDLSSKLAISNSCHWRSTPSTCNSYAFKLKTYLKDTDLTRKHSQNQANNVSNDNGKFIELWNRGYTLYSPIPGFSTHCEAELLSPCTDWENIINNTY